MHPWKNIQKQNIYVSRGLHFFMPGTPPESVCAKRNCKDKSEKNRHHRLHFLKKTQPIKHLLFAKKTKLLFWRPFPFVRGRVCSIIRRDRHKFFLLFATREKGSDRVCYNDILTDVIVWAFFYMLFFSITLCIR